MMELDPTKITIGIELECLLVHSAYPKQYNINYNHYIPISTYWEAHTDGSINDKSRPNASAPNLDLIRYYRDKYSNYHWTAIELSTAFDAKPIRLSDLDNAIDDLATLLDLSSETEPWHHRIQINHTCGAHLHLSIDDLNPMSAGVFNLARVRYRNWLRQERGAETVAVFDAFYHRGGYANPMRAGLLDVNRKDFCINLGIEWRGFHLMKVESIKDMRERLHAAFKAFAEAYYMSSTISEKVFILEKLKIPVPQRLDTKTITIYNPFPKVLPCAI